MLFHALNEKYEVSSKYKHEIFTLIENATDQFDPNDLAFETVTNFVEEQFGYSKVVSLTEAVLKNRKSMFLMDSLGDGYRVKQHKNTNASVVADTYIELIIKYVNAQNYEEESLAFELVRYFRPEYVIIPELEARFSKLIEQFADDDSALYKIAKTIRLFQNYQENFVLLADICQRLYELDFTFDKYNKVFGTDFYLNFGSRSKVGFGVTMKEDIVKEKRFLKCSKMSDTMTDY